MFTAVEFERRNGQPVFVQPRHVASLEPLEGKQVTETLMVMATGDHFELKDSPSQVLTRLRAGA